MSPSHARRGGRGGRQRQDGGQAVVELALALPLLVVVLLGVAQVVVVAVHQVALVNATRDAVRAASVSAEPDTAARTSVARLLPEAECATSVDGSTVTVILTSQDVTDVPLIGAVIPTVELTSRATMTLEPP